VIAVSMRGSCAFKSLTLGATEAELSICRAGKQVSGRAETGRRARSARQCLFYGAYDQPSIQRIAAFCGWFAVAAAALLVMVVALTPRANVEHTGLDMTACRTGLGLYLASTVLLLVSVYRQFRRPSEWQATTPR
jgi:hypothetical protein